MTVTYTKSFWDAESSKYITETKTGFQGATLRAYTDTIQVMSDIWETFQFVTVWDEASQSAETIMDPKAYVVDATPEVIQKFLESYGAQQYEFFLSQSIGQYTKDVLQLKKDDMVVVTQGKTKPPKPGAYPIVAVIQSSYKLGWKSIPMRKFGLALSDKKAPVTASNGKTYDRFVDVIWVWERNVEPADKDQRLSTVAGLAEPSARRRALSEVSAMLDKITKSQGKTLGSIAATEAA